jgi:hypothetical protein
VCVRRNVRRQTERPQATRARVLHCALYPGLYHTYKYTSAGVT